MSGEVCTMMGFEWDVLMVQRRCSRYEYAAPFVSSECNVNAVV
jgi:hypothetical protein